jgi:hypothetical protein
MCLLHFTKFYNRTPYLLLTSETSSSIFQIEIQYSMDIKTLFLRVHCVSGNAKISKAASLVADMRKFRRESWIHAADNLTFQNWDGSVNPWLLRLRTQVYCVRILGGRTSGFVTVVHPVLRISFEFWVAIRLFSSCGAERFRAWVSEGVLVFEFQRSQWAQKMSYSVSQNHIVRGRCYFYL